MSYMHGAACQVKLIGNCAEAWWRLFWTPMTGTFGFPQKVPGLGPRQAVNPGSYAVQILRAPRRLKITHYLEKLAHYFGAIPAKPISAGIWTSGILRVGCHGKPQKSS